MLKVVKDPGKVWGGGGVREKKEDLMGTSVGRSFEGAKNSDCLHLLK